MTQYWAVRARFLGASVTFRKWVLPTREYTGRDGVRCPTEADLRMANSLPLAPERWVAKYLAISTRDRITLQLMSSCSHDTAPCISHADCSRSRDRCISGRDTELLRVCARCAAFAM